MDVTTMAKHGEEGLELQTESDAAVGYLPDAERQGRNEMLRQRCPE
jgi:hypothetical protein